jgi:hypothetical protein
MCRSTRQSWSTRIAGRRAGCCTPLLHERQLVSHPPRGAVAVGMA